MDHFPAEIEMPPALADVLREDVGIPIERLTAAANKMPYAATIIVQLLEAIDGLSLEHSLTLESLAYAALQGGAEHDKWLRGRPSAAAHPPGDVKLDRSGNSLHVLLDRPAALNAIDSTMRDALFDAFALVNADPSIDHVRIRAAGRAFGMGADLSEFGTTRDPAKAHAIRMATSPARQMIQRSAIYDVHVDGGCVGSSLELAAFAGRLTASSRAWFQLPELAMGILPGFGGCVSISKRIGRHRAIALILSGQRINARKALDWGLIDAIVDEPSADPSCADKVGR